MNRLQEKATLLNVNLSDEQIKQFETYYDMLIETNKVMNLTAITELEEVITKHFLDSLLLAKVYPDIMDQDIKVLDLEPGQVFREFR